MIIGLCDASLDIEVCSSSVSPVNNMENSNDKVIVKNNQDVQQVNNKDTEIQDEDLGKSYVNEMKVRLQQHQRDRNKHDPANIEYPDEGFFVKLDSSIKKNTAFVKKIRNMTESQRSIILKDFESLNLSHYVSELASAIVETKIKVAEIPMCVEICSVMHLRYRDFARQLLDSWNKYLPRKSSDSVNLSKMRLDLRLFTELILCGILPGKDSLPILGNLLTFLICTDKDKHNHLNIILGFCKQYSYEFVGLVPLKMQTLLGKYDLSLPRSDFLAIERQKGIQNLLKDYYKSLVARIINDNKHLRYLEREMKKNLMTRGEIFKSQQDDFDAKNLDFQKLWQSIQVFSDLLNEGLPDLPVSAEDDDDILGDKTLSFDFTNRFRDNVGTDQLWEDEESKIFYEHLPDLKSQIPAILYKDSLKEDQSLVPIENTSQSKTTKETSESELSSSETLPKVINVIDETSIEDKDDLADADLNEQEFVESQADDAGSIEPTNDNKTQNKGSIGGLGGATKNQFDLLISNQLLTCWSREDADKAALVFATTLNTKNNRKRLVDAMMAVPRTRLDLLPFYSRFIAQLVPIMPTVGTDLVAALKRNFRGYFKFKDQIIYESKIKNSRFIGELTKFGVFPKTDTLFIIKVITLVSLLFVKLQFL